MKKMMLLIHIWSTLRIKVVEMRVMKRMKILLLTKMMVVLQPMILERRNLMLVKVEMRKRNLGKRNPEKRLCLPRQLLLRRNLEMEMKMVQRRKNRKRRRIQMHQRGQCLVSCSSKKWKKSNRRRQRPQRYSMKEFVDQPVEACTETVERAKAAT